MNLSKHTPGPWSVSHWRKDGPSTRRIATVAIVGDCVVGPDHGSPEMARYDEHGTDEADARLIAAAPDLLAALVEATDHLAELYAKYQTKIGPFASQSQRINVLGRAAIAKATGAAK